MTIYSVFCQLSEWIRVKKKGISSNYSYIGSNSCTYTRYILESTALFSDELSTLVVYFIIYRYNNLFWQRYTFGNYCKTAYEKPQFVTFVLVELILVAWFLFAANGSLKNFSSHLFRIIKFGLNVCYFTTNDIIWTITFFFVIFKS